MKKFDIKWILILVLVLVLAFGLVACNNKGGGEQQEEDEEQKTVDPNQSSPKEFFAALWDSSKAIGATEVDPTTDKIHIGMALDLSLTSKSVTELDVGVEFGIVADLAAMNKAENANKTEPNLGDTALMLKAYDKITKDNWVTVWYFLSEKDYIYLQVQDEKFQVKFDAYWNNQFSTLLEGVLKMPIGILSGTDNLLTLINDIAASGGNDWTLDTLLLGDGEPDGFGGLLAAFGLNLSEILNNDTVKKILPKNVDTNSLGSLLQGMGGIVLESKGCKKYTESDGSVTYKATQLSSTATTLLNGFTDGLFNQISALSLSFNVKNNDINGLTIALTGKKDLNNTEIKINITDLTIEKTNGTAATSTLKKTGTFDPYVNIDWTGRMNASAWGAKLNIDGEQISIGNVVAQLKASVDLTGAKGENKTAAQLIITNDNQKVLTVEYKDNTLILETDLSNANNAKIAKVGLYPLAKLIKEAAVGTNSEAVAVPYKVFGDMADEVISKMFTVSAGKVTAVKPEFTTIAITNVDIQVLAKGAFYAIFSDIATGSGEEKPAEAKELETYDGASYKLGNKTYTDSQYSWGLNILNTVKVVLNALKYDATSKDYSITLEKLSTTLLGLFKDGETSKDKIKYTKPANIDEMMALFMCTNDGILLDMTKHGLLPLYNDGITNKYIADATNEEKNTLTLDDAASLGYSAIPGKLISKQDAVSIWNYLTSTADSPKLTLSGITVGKYYDADGDKEDDAAYVQNSAIAWFVKLVAGSTVTNGSTAKSIVGDLAGANSKIMISLNRETGKMACDVKLNNLSTTGDITYTISGTDKACEFTSTTKAAAAANVVVDLDDNFYNLFKAQFGMGPTTVINVAEDNYGINNDIYYIGEAEWNTASGSYDSITYSGAALIRVKTNTDPIYFVVYYDFDAANQSTYTGFIPVTATFSDGSVTIEDSTVVAFNDTYTIKGVAVKVIEK